MLCCADSLPIMVRQSFAEHFELCLTLGESIIDSVYGEPDQAAAGQLFFVLNTESSFALGIGHVIEQLESAQAGLGEAFYDSLRQSLYRWVRVYDDWDARERIEQMTEMAEGEDDPDSYEIPKLEPDLPACLRNRKFTDRGQPLASFSLPRHSAPEESGRTRAKTRACIALGRAAQD